MTVMRIFVALPLLLSGCTAIILSDAAQDAALPCESAGDCGAGFACEDGACSQVTEEGKAPPAPEVVGEDGGTLRGPDGMTVTFPEGALDGGVRFSIARGSDTTVPRTANGEVTTRSRFYVVEPPLALAVPATVTLPLTGTCAGCSVLIEGEDGLWLELAGGAVEDLTITATTDVLGAFVAGEAP